MNKKPSLLDLIVTFPTNAEVQRSVEREIARQQRIARWDRRLRLIIAAVVVGAIIILVATKGLP